LRRIILTLVLLALLATTDSLAQGRVFSRGESGIMGGIDFHGFLGGRNESYDGSNWIGLTLKNRVDLGIGGGASYNQVVINGYYFANVVILDHAGPRLFGLEAGARYARADQDVYSYSELSYFRREEEFLQVHGQVFHRFADEEDGRLLAGLTVLHRYSKYEFLDETGVVLTGRERGEWGLAGHADALFFGWLYLGARLEYSQDQITDTGWGFVVSGRVGLTISFGGRAADGDDG
jgi:hypothetical protein